MVRARSSAGRASTGNGHGPRCATCARCGVHTVRLYRLQRVAARYGVTLAKYTSRLVGRAPYVLPGPFHVIPTVVGVETMPS
ncbi:hypothetical protein BH11GEM2_BH11GEM2_35230 [soil metagenome]